MKKNFGRLAFGLLLLCMQSAGAAGESKGSDALIVLDLPPAEATPETRAAVVRQIADALPADTRLGIVAADKSDGDVLSALGEPPIAVKAIEAASVQPAVTKDPAAAVERALYELRIGGRPNVARAIVFVGDARTQDDRAVDRRTWMLGPLVQEAVRNNTRIFFVAWGEDSDMEVAQTLARETGGEYFRAASVDALRAVAPSIKRLLAEPPTSVPQPVAVNATPIAPTAPAPVATMPAAASASPPVIEDNGEAIDSVHPAPESDRWAGIGLAGLVGLGVLASAIAAFLIARRVKPDVGRGSVRATPNAYLVDLHGSTPLSRYVLGARPVVIGRIAGKDTRQFDYITVPINTVSRRHAVIEYRDGAYWVIDQGSVNGTRINDKRIKGKHKLQHGDRIGLHRCELQFETEAVSIDGDQTISADSQTFGATTQIAPAATVAAMNAVPASAGPSTNASSSSDANNAKTLIATPRESTSPPVLTVPELPRVAAEAAPEVPKKSLDSFINTTLIQQNDSPPDDGLSAQTDITFAPVDTHSGELSIEDFMDVSEPFTPLEMPTAVAATPAPPQQSTQKLSTAMADVELDEFRLGDTVNLFDPESFGETTPLEQFLREHATDDGIKASDETKLVKSEWEKSRKQQ
ncbi:MAG: FHA domain-containing protein [Gammaproteobacteria bacterium]